MKMARWLKYLVLTLMVTVINSLLLTGPSLSNNLETRLFSSITGCLLPVLWAVICITKYRDKSERLVALFAVLLALLIIIWQASSLALWIEAR